MIKAVPDNVDPGRYECTNFKESKFIELKSSELFDVQLQYPIKEMKYAEERCYVREEVFERLHRVARLLPHGYKLRIWDAWRPFKLQLELYESYSKDILSFYDLQNSTIEEQKAYINRFVSFPEDNREIPPVHTTGGAVDLTIIDENGDELDMGTSFDSFSNLTYTSSYEGENNSLIKNNRRLLYHVMISVGFTNLPSEWWHYDFGDRYWAYYKKEPALYRGVFTIDEMTIKEKR